jgi:hypothetical protein
MDGKYGKTGNEDSVPPPALLFHFGKNVLDCHDHPDASPGGGPDIKNNHRAIRLLLEKSDSLRDSR